MSKKGKTSRRHLSRRTFLRGAVGGTAVSLALPVLDAMVDSGGALADGTDFGPFFGVFFWANGLPWHDGHGAQQAGHANVWRPGTTGADFAPSPLLVPLMRHRVSVATGLQPHTAVPPEPGGQGDGHMRGFMNALTGDRIRPEGFDHPSHTLTALRPSIDQVVATHPEFYGTRRPRFRSIIAGASTARFHDYGHWNAISYNGPDALNQPILDPAVLHARLFDVPADAIEAGRDARLLDAVLEDARSLQTRLGADDRRRIDAHLDHIREVQRQLEIGAALCDTPPAPGGPVGLGRGSVVEKARIMGSLLGLAIRCNVTRVFSFMLTSPASTHVFDNVGVPDGLHKTVHDGHWDRTNAVMAHQMEAFASFLDGFELEEMDGSLLDRGVVYGCSEYGEGYKHSVIEMPVVFAGGGCGKLARGVHARDEGGNIVDAHLTSLRALGLETESFGWNGGETADHISGLVL